MVTLISIIGGREKGLIIEHVFFNFSCFFSSVYLILSILLNFYPELNKTLLLIYAVALFLAISIYIISRLYSFSYYLVWLFIILAQVYLSMLFLYNGGNNGSSFFMFYALYAILVFILNRKGRIIALLSILINSIILFYVDYSFLVFTYNKIDSYHQVIEKPIIFSFSLFFIYFTIIYGKKHYINEKEKAKESDRLKSAFLANVSHEIRTPMNAIIGFSKLLKERSLVYGKGELYADIIAMRSRELLNLINDIIDIAKIEANQFLLCKKPFYLNHLLDDLYTNYYYEIKLNSKNVKLRLNKYMEVERSLINSDPIRLKQILNNLISNAIKFTDSGAIEFGYNIIDNSILFYVKDTGIGISIEEKDVIFEKFRQASLSTERIYGGTGLGLSICKNIVELLGGRIWVESKLGEGSTFCFTIKRELSNKELANSSQ